MAEKKEKRYVSDNAQLMTEWHSEKNTELGFQPQELTCGSGRKVWWRCSKGHEWQATINNRNTGYGCPYCSGRNVLKGHTDLLTVNPSVVREWNYEKNGELNPEDFTANNHIKVWWKCSRGHEWKAAISNRNKGAGCPYCAGQKAIIGSNDLQTTNPGLASEWNYEKNIGLMPADVLPSSNKKVWWKCAKGHEWQSTVNHRSRGNGCPICNSERHTSFPEFALLFYLNKSGLRTLHSYNERGYELDVFIPEKMIAIEYDGYYWHKNKANQDVEKNIKCKKDGIKLYRMREGLPSLNDSSIDFLVQKDNKNFGLILNELLQEIIGTSINVDIERDYVAIESLREHTEKERSLLFTNPRIAREWDYEKNGTLRPEHVTPNSSKKIWWKCIKGHEWQARIDSRCTGNGCPYCSGRKTIIGHTDLQTLNPSVAREWNYEKNGELRPDNYSANSHAKVWWRCSKGHEWQAIIKNRSLGSGCPYCSGRKIVRGVNDLQTVNPILADEWNREKNGEVTPSDVMPNSGSKVWWKCSNGHEWQATIDSRNKGHGCPYCSGRKAVIGHTDLVTVNPSVACEWNYEKNGELRPENYSANSHAKVWWRCSKGHEWQATIYNRNSGRACPICKRKRNAD